MPQVSNASCGKCQHHGIAHEQHPEFHQCLRILRLMDPSGGVVMEPDDMAFTDDSCGHFSAIYTYQDFGCVLFEPKG